VTILLNAQRMETPIGDFILVADGQGVLRAADFADCEERLHKLLRRRLGQSGFDFTTGELLSDHKRAVLAYFAGDISAIGKVPITACGSPFQERVWSALRETEPGRPITYAALANSLGCPSGAARAVGYANGANPFCIIVPCHRLVGAGGALTGYSGGLDRKRWLLEHERRHTCGQSA
jgi:methylated-DNA-[protein]-cysteine S-methyltransferase